MGGLTCKVRYSWPLLAALGVGVGPLSEADSSPPFPSLTLVSAALAQFFNQGDCERAAGLPISPLMDRTKEGITRSQPGFFNIVALPLYSAFCSAFTGCLPLHDGVKDNFSRWVGGCHLAVGLGVGTLHWSALLTEIPVHHLHS